MPPLTEARKQEILTAIQANRVPTRGASNQTILVTSAGATRRHNRYVVLADGAGKLTPAFTTRPLAPNDPAQLSARTKS